MVSSKCRVRSKIELFLHPHYNKVVAEVTSGADGVYDCGSVPAGELVVVCAEDNHAMSKRKVTLETDVGPGTIEEKGPADVALPQPLSDENKLEVVLDTHSKAIRRVYQHYCSAGAVGENNPFTVTRNQWELFGVELALPGGTKKAMEKKMDKWMDGLFSESGKPTTNGFGFDDEGEPDGGDRPLTPPLPIRDCLII